jgi:hypothetical protein
MADNARDDVPEVDAGLDQLAQEWPEWRPWRSQRGELVCATRRVGRCYTLVADNECQLRAQLRYEADQEIIRQAALPVPPEEAEAS